MKELRVSKDLTLPLEWMTLATVVYGARGSGKTSLGRVLAEETNRARQRFCAIDLKGDWWGLKSTSDGKGEGIPVVVFGGDHADVPLEEGAGAEVARIVAELPQSTILDFEHLSKGKQLRFQAAFFAALYDANRDPLVLLMDEAQRYAPQKTFDPESAKCLGAVEDLVKLGRKHGIAPVLFTQRGSGLNKEVSELCDLLVAFRTPGPLDQDRVEAWLDANTTKAQRVEVMGKLAGLPTGTAVFASGHPDLKLFGVHAVRRPGTFDSSATPKIGERRVEPKHLAKPDLDALRSKMSASIERAKADDPKALRSRIAELEKQVRAASNGQPAKLTPPAAPTGPRREDLATIHALRKALEKAMKIIVQINAEDFLKAEGVDAGEIQKAIDAATQRVTALLERKLDDRSKAVDKLRREAASVLQSLKALLDSDVAVDVTVARVAPVPASYSVKDERGAKSRRAAPTTAPGDTSLGKCERSILAAIAQHGTLTLTQASIIAGYSTSSSTPGNAASKLRGLGYLEGENTQGMTITDAGAKALGEHEELPTGRELLAWWLGQLGKCEAAILSEVAEHYPDAVSLKAAAEAHNYSLSSSTPGNAASKLRTLCLVTGSNAGMTADKRLV